MGGVVSQRWAVAFVVVAILGSAFPSVAQQTTLAPNVVAPSAQNSVIRNQLTLAKKFEQQALQGFMAIPGDNSIPVDEASHQAARDAYVLIRAARHGMGWQKEAKKYPDPVFDLIFKRVEEAWHLSRTAVDHAGQPGRAVQDASQAIRLLDQVLVMMP